MSGGSVNRMYEEFAKEDHVINCRMYSLPCYRGGMDVPRKPRCWQPALWISRWESPITKSINCRINDVYAETFCIDVYGLHGYCARHYNGTARGSKRNAKYGGKILTKMSKRGALNIYILSARWLHCGSMTAQKCEWFVWPRGSCPSAVRTAGLPTFLRNRPHFLFLSTSMSNSRRQTKTVRLTVIAADGLVKKDLFFKLPDPFGQFYIDSVLLQRAFVI